MATTAILYLCTKRRP